MLKELFQSIPKVNLMMAAVDELYRNDLETVNELKTESIIESFKYHYNNNKVFRDKCNERAIFPKDMKELSEIPLINVNTFKDVRSHELLTAKIQDIELEMHSTGTSGIPSVARRDKKSVDNATLGILAMYREFFGISRGMGLFLFPPTKEMPEMALAKALNIFAGYLDGSENIVQNLLFNSEDAMNKLLEWEGKHTRHIFGPPFLIYRFLKYLIRNNIKLNLDKSSLVVTVGGWKQFTGQEIPRKEFNRICCEMFNIPEENIRDIYGLVEANMVATECKFHNKHVPPWVHVSIRDINDPSKEVEKGKKGIVAILDPSLSSYPGFILTEDVGKIENFECECGRKGQIIKFISRLKGAEVGCCAINLEQKMYANKVEECNAKL